MASKKGGTADLAASLTAERHTTTTAASAVATPQHSAATDNGHQQPAAAEFTGYGVNSVVTKPAVYIDNASEAFGALLNPHAKANTHSSGYAILSAATGVAYLVAAAMCAAVVFVPVMSRDEALIPPAPPLQSGESLNLSSAAVGGAENIRINASPTGEEAADVTFVGGAEDKRKKRDTTQRVRDERSLLCHTTRVFPSTAPNAQPPSSRTRCVYTRSPPTKQRPKGGVAATDEGTNDGDLSAPPADVIGGPLQFRCKKEKILVFAAVGTAAFGFICALVAAFVSLADSGLRCLCVCGCKSQCFQRRALPALARLHIPLCLFVTLSLFATYYISDLYRTNDNWCKAPSSNKDKKKKLTLEESHDASPPSLLMAAVEGEGSWGVADVAGLDKRSKPPRPTATPTTAAPTDDAAAFYTSFASQRYGRGVGVRVALFGAAAVALIATARLLFLRFGGVPRAGARCPRTGRLSGDEQQQQQHYANYSHVYRESSALLSHHHHHNGGDAAGAARRGSVAIAIRVVGADTTGHLQEEEAPQPLVPPFVDRAAVYGTSAPHSAVPADGVVVAPRE